MNKSISRRQLAALRQTEGFKGACHAVAAKLRTVPMTEEERNLWEGAAVERIAAEYGKARHDVATEVAHAFMVMI